MTWEKIEGGFAPIWKPANMNDALEGKVVKKGESQFGIYLEVELPDESVIQTPAHKVIQNRIAGFVVGDSIKIVFTGMKKGNMGMMNQYDIFRQPASTTPATTTTPPALPPALPADTMKKHIKIMDGGNGAPLANVKLAFQAETGLSEGVADMVFLGLKNEGKILEMKNGMVKAI